MQSNIRDKVLFRSPRDEQERASVAGACVRRLGIKFPAVIDGFDNQVETAYTGWPDRMYLIASDGRVLYKSKPGPFGFHPQDLATAINKIAGSGVAGVGDLPPSVWIGAQEGGE
jgi:Iodothyronine deiodinase